MCAPGAERSAQAEAAEQLRAYLQRRYPDIFPIKLNTPRDAEHGTSRIEVVPRPGANARVSTIDWNLLDSPEYQEAHSIEQDLRSIGAAPYKARSGGAEQCVPEHDVDQADAQVRDERPAGRRPVATRDVAWTLCSVVVTVAALLGAFGMIWDAVIEGRWTELLGVPIVLVVWFFLSVGAWRRTTWASAST